MSVDINKDLPLVSVIIPTYNRRDMLKIAIDSVLKQDYENIEIIVSDNNSTCDTDILMQEYLEKYNNIKYIKRDKNYGAFYNGYNAYKENSQGEYIFFLYDDDYLMGTTFIKNAVNVLENNGNVVLVTGFVVMYFEVIDKYITLNYNSDTLISGIDYFIRQSTVSFCKQYPEIISSFFLIRRKAIENNPIFPRFEQSGDLSIMSYTPSLGDIYFLHEFVGCYNLHENFRETSNFETLEKDIDKSFELIDILVKRYSDLYPAHKDFFEKYIHIKISDIFIRDRIYKTFKLYNKKNIKKLKRFLKNYKIKEKSKIIYKFLCNTFFPKLIFNVNLFIFRISKDNKYLQISILGINLNIKLLNNNNKYYKTPKLYAYAIKDIKEGDKIEAIYFLEKTENKQISSDTNIRDFIASKNISKGTPITKLNSVNIIREREREFIVNSQYDSHNYTILIYFCQPFKEQYCNMQVGLFSRNSYFNNFNNKSNYELSNKLKEAV